MSLTLNMVGGGSGGLKATDAILRVIAPAQSVVTITKGSVSKSDVGHENAINPTVYDYYFIIHQSQFDSVNPWTVTAVLQTSSSTGTIIIDAANEYNMIMSYHVPPEYQEVEFIQSTGSQYINTNYVVKANDSFQIIAQMTAWGSSGFPNDSIIYEATSWAQNRCVIEFNGSHGARVVWGNNSYRDSSNWITDLNTDFTFNVYPNLVFNGVNYGGVAVTAQSRPGFLFAANDVGALNRLSYVKLKYFKITDSSNVVQREFYPCYRRSDSVAGLWDKKNEVFYTNAGSGSFVVGSDIGGDVQ